MTSLTQNLVKSFTNFKFFESHWVAAQFERVLIQSSSLFPLCHTTLVELWVFISQYFWVAVGYVFVKHSIKLLHLLNVEKMGFIHI